MKKKLTFLTGFVMMSFIGFSQTISTFPYTEDFEAEAACGTGCGAVCNTLVDFNNSTADDLDWSVDAGGTSSSSTGPSVDHTLGTAAGQYVYVETSCNGTGYSNKQALLESPWLNFTAMPSISLSFWYHAFGATTGNLNVEARITSSGAWTNVAGPITDNIDAWQEAVVNLSAVYGGMDSVQVRFNYVSGTSFTGDIGLDDITFSPPVVRDLSASDLAISTQCTYGATEPVTVTVCNLGDTTFNAGSIIPVNYSVNGGTPVMENVTLTAPLMMDSCVDYTFTALANLSASGAFSIEAWTGYLGDQDLSNDTASLSGFNSVGNSIPYFENFESGQNGWTVNNGANGSWGYGTPANTIINSAASGDSAFVTNLTGDYSSNEDGNVTSPCIDITGANGSEIVQMKVWWNSENSWDGANLFSSVDGGATWNQVGAFGDPTNWYNDNSINGNPNGSGEGWTGRNSSGNGSGGWVCAQHTLDSAMMVGNGTLLLRVGFGSDGSVSDEGFAFDDVAIGYPIAYNGLVDSVLAICDTEYTIDAGAGYLDYRWSTGETTQTITVNSAGSYSVAVSDSTGICGFDTTYIDLLNFVRPNLTDIVTCSGDTAFWDANTGGSSYIWSTGDSTQTSMLTMPGTITVTKADASSGCIETDTATFTYNVEVDLGADVDVCVGDSVVIDATTSNATYVWSTGETTATLTVTTSGSYTVTVTDTVLGCPSSADTVNLIVNTLPVVNLGSDITDCDDAVIDGTTGSVATYLWSNSDTTAMTTVTASGTYGLVVVDTNGCIGGDTINVTINTATPVNLGADTTVCDTVGITLDAGVGTSYLWQDGSTNQTFTPTDTVTATYYVTVTDSNGCTASDSINVTIDVCTGIGELTNGVSVNLYPNPTKGMLTLSLSKLTDNGTITITNIYGQVVRVENVNSTTTNLDLTGLSNGTYTFRLQVNESILIDKFIINR